MELSVVMSGRVPIDVEWLTWPIWDPAPTTRWRSGQRSEISVTMRFLIQWRLRGW